MALGWYRQVVDAFLREDGRFVLENVLEAVVPEIKNAIQDAQAASEKRISQRTAAYEGSAAGLAVKRLQNNFTGEIIVRSDNKAYDPLTFNLADLHLLGRVVYILNAKKV